MTKIRIPIHKHYLIIDSPVGFHLLANEGLDDVYRPAGAWQLDLWQLLTKEYFKQYPVFTLDLEYDESLLGEGAEVVYRESDINLGTGLSGVNGQGVILLGDSVGLAKENTLQFINDKLNDLPKETTVSTLATESTVSGLATESSLLNLINKIDNLKKNYNLYSSPWLFFEQFVDWSEVSHFYFFTDNMYMYDSIHNVTIKGNKIIFYYSGDNSYREHTIKSISISREDYDPQTGIYIPYFELDYISSITNNLITEKLYFSDYNLVVFE